MAYTELLFSITDRVCTITLSRPEKRNALNAELVRELREAFEEAEEREDVRVVVLTGAGDAFCAGADLAYLQNISRNSPHENAGDSANLMETLYAIRTCKKPVIAKVNGHALAGGCGLALACDIVVAQNKARFGFTEVRIGFVPAIVMKIAVERMGRGKAVELFLRGNQINASLAASYGMINQVVEPEELGAAVSAIANEIAIETSPEAIRRTKQLLNEIEGMNLRDAMRHASTVNALARTGEDFRKGIRSFLEKKPPTWE